MIRSAIAQPSPAWRVPFNVPFQSGDEPAAFTRLLGAGRFCGDGAISRSVQETFEREYALRKVLLTPSCTAALEMAALLLDVQPGDEVIVPSFTFVSTASAFALRGARIQFVDIRPDTLNLDESAVAEAITKRTRVIVPLHYAGVAAEMDTILALGREHAIAVVEDAAQGVGALYRGRALGGIGDIGCWSFHETKNFHCGEGGAIVINQPELVARGEILRDKGTDRGQFLRGEVDKYTWRDLGGSFLLSEVNAAFLTAQQPAIRSWTERRMALWSRYRTRLAPVSEKAGIGLPHVPEGLKANGHIFYVILRSAAERTETIAALGSRGVQATTHYVPLHSSEEGRKVGEMVGTDRYTTDLSSRLLRLPMHNRLTDDDVDFVCDSLEDVL